MTRDLLGKCLVIQAFMEDCEPPLFVKPPTESGASAVFSVDLDPDADDIMLRAAALGLCDRVRATGRLQCVVMSEPLGVHQWCRQQGEYVAVSLIAQYEIGRNAVRLTASVAVA